MENRERMKRIRKRISRYRSRYEKRIIGCLCVFCVWLTAGMGHLLNVKQQAGIFTMQSEYGSVLLHSSGEPYIVIGVVAFMGGAAFTMLCIRLNRRKKLKEAEEVRG